MIASSQVLIVTGGSRGIGAAVAAGAARHGYAVAVNYKGNRARADAVVAGIVKAGGKAVAIAADVAHESDVERLFAETDQALGRVTALVNNAGILGPLGRLDAAAAAPLEELFAINVIGTMLCTREAVKRMSTKHGGGGGAIVNVSSVLARLGGAGETVPYAATKAAIDTFTFGLAQEVATEGIRVNAVSPGIVDTELHPAGRLARLLPGAPMKRPGRPDEVANAILWLLSSEASYVSGAILGISGGR
ncbi:MAG: SDR family oxidoreductase [Alphaproteobacteria bacterium]|nr:SDR family oxidoreductase [Alphaproteobacteria bacterium]